MTKIEKVIANAALAKAVVLKIQTECEKDTPDFESLVEWIAQGEDYFDRMNNAMNEASE